MSVRLHMIAMYNVLIDQLNIYIYIYVINRSHDFLDCDNPSGLALKLVQTRQLFDLFIGLSPYYTRVDITRGNIIN